MSEAEEQRPQSYRRIIVVGGGCYGSYYVRQLERALKAGAIAAEQIIVVDRDPNCTVAQLDSSHQSHTLLVEEWRAFFADYLARAAEQPEKFARDAIVPSPLMPHLMGEWLTARAQSRFPDRTVSTSPFEHLPKVPWERAGAAGAHYVSFATWMCPVNCIEPRICPHTRDTRTWSMPEALSEYSKEESAHGRPVVVAVMFCRHRAYGVGMFDTLEVIDAEARVGAAAEKGAAEVIVGTVSHCHGALTRLLISRPATTDSPIA